VSSYDAAFRGKRTNNAETLREKGREVPEKKKNTRADEEGYARKLAVRRPYRGEGVGVKGCSGRKSAEQLRGS